VKIQRTFCFAATVLITQLAVAKLPFTNDIFGAGTSRTSSCARSRYKAFIGFAGVCAGNRSALHRFVEREPLRRVHECVFGVLALESEPVEPRL